jgi:hypothetical protein
MRKRMLIAIGLLCWIAVVAFGIALRFDMLPQPPPPPPSVTVENFKRIRVGTRLGDVEERFGCRGKLDRNAGYEYLVWTGEDCKVRIRFLAMGDYDCVQSGELITNEGDVFTVP